MNKKFFAIIIISWVVLIIFGLPEKANAGSEHNVSGWAWASNIGWISFNSTNTGAAINYGVNINPSTGLFSGYAWSRGTTANPGGIGWIKFDPVGPYPTSPNYSACLDLPGSGQVCDGVGNYTISGWARACAGTANPDVCATGTNPVAGGWDGWIKLRGTNYGVWIDSSVSPAEFRNWAWGGDDSTSTAVVGWISFNHKNCDTNGDGFSDGIGACPSAGTPISPYKVITNLNNKPYLESVTSTEGYCNIEKGVGQINFKWTYRDSDGDNQSEYNLQIATSSTFIRNVVDYTTSQNVSPDNEGTSAVLIVRDPNVDTRCGSNGSFEGRCIAFGPPYWWRVRAKDTNNSWSDWKPDPPASFTPLHPYPWIDFDWDKKPTIINEEVQFTANSTCYNNVNLAETLCSTTTGATFSWTFPGTKGTNYQCIDPTLNCEFAQNPKIRFLTTLAAGSQVSLTVCAPAGSCCSGNKPITVTLPLPQYRPVAPIGRLDNFLARIVNIFQ